MNRERAWGMDKEFNQTVLALSDRECTTVMMNLWGAFEDNEEFMKYFKMAVNRVIDNRKETK